MQQPLPSLRRLRKTACPNIHLQARVQKPRRPELPIALRPQRHELALGDAVVEVLVLGLVLLDRHVGDGVLAPVGRVVVARPDLHLVRQAEQLLGRGPEVLGAAAGEVAAGGADVGVEDGVAAEDVV